jgi:predicted amidohydrolase
MLHIFPQLKQLQYNINLLNRLTLKALQNGANIVVAPELATTGYCITAQDVRGGLGLSAPFNSLGYIKNLAVQYSAYITLGIAEISNDSLYNSAIMFKPDGSYFLQRKRGLAGWNARGNIPFNVVPTKYGNIGLAICSDTYLMDWMRIMAINGADLVLTPANWWGDAGQLNTWTTRAYENGVHMVIANRWGTETDNRFNPPYLYNMNDAPSSVIVPTPDYTIAAANQVQFVYRANQSSKPKDTVLFQTLKIPAQSINGYNQTWMLAARQPAAYPQLANTYYRPDLGNRPVPGLPPAGYIKVGVMSYQQYTDVQKNLSIMYNYWNASSKNADILVLPAMGIAIGAIDITNPGWYKNSPWTDLQTFVEQNNIQLLTTSVYVNYGSQYPNRETMVAIQPNKPIVAIPAIHGWSPAYPAPVPPIYIDTDSARVGIVLDHDMLMPETALDLVKIGADILVLPFDYGTDLYTPNALGADNWPYNLLQTYSNIVCHIAASNDYGFGAIVENGGGYISQFVTTGATQGNGFKIIKLNSQTVRKKFLNAYYSFDLDVLLGHNYKEIPLRPVEMQETSLEIKPSNYGSIASKRSANKKKKTEIKTAVVSNGELREKKRHLLPPGLNHK